MLDFCGRPQYAVAIEEPVGEGVARLDGYWLDVDSRTRDVDPVVGDADALEGLMRATAHLVPPHELCTQTLDPLVLMWTGRSYNIDPAHKATKRRSQDG